MGSCFSSVMMSTAAGDSPPTTAKVIAVDGSLRECSLPITVSKVLGIDRLTCFLCSSDALHFDAHISPLEYGEFLQPQQIYFVLPKSKLGFRLAGDDMAALAVKASAALGSVLVNDNKEKRVVMRRKKRRMINIKIVPFGLGGNDDEGCVNNGVGRLVEKKLARVVMRTLSTIEEATTE